MKYFRTFRGVVSTLKGLGKRHFDLKDIISIVELTLRVTAFCASGRIWSQHRGTAIGGHISPVLSSIAIAHHEVMWLRSFKQWREFYREQLFIARYVDNRFALVTSTCVQTLPAKMLFSETFYKSPVVLEDEPDLSLLGFTVDPLQRTIRYNSPKEDWQFRHVDSSGTINQMLSGFRSRTSLICKYTWPKSQVDVDLQMLVQQYHVRGYDIESLQLAVTRMKARCMHISDFSP